MLQPKPQRMTVDEFLDWQLKQDKLYELVDGIPLLPLKMMAGATQRHDLVTVACLGMLYAQLRGKKCRAITDDVAVKTPLGLIRRPDIAVDCGPGPANRTILASEPRVVIEVLSPSTLSYDRFRKVEEYKTVPSIQVIILLDTEQPRATVHRRSGAQQWSVTAQDGLDQTIELPEIEARLPLAEVYERLSFE